METKHKEVEGGNKELYDMSDEKGLRHERLETSSNNVLDQNEMLGREKEYLC